MLSDQVQKHMTLILISTPLAEKASIFKDLKECFILASLDSTNLHNSFFYPLFKNYSPHGGMN